MRTHTPSNDRAPDIVLFMSDQQRFDQVGYASDGHFETPALDALAARGVVFEHAYSAGTTCVPSRNALLTGIQPHRLPAQENGIALREGCWTIAHALRRAGYQTAAVGKMHFAPVHSDHGFDTMRLCEHLVNQGLGPMSRERDDEFDDYHDDLIAAGLPDWRFGPLSQQIPFPLPSEMHPTAWIEREAGEILRTRDPRRPLFLIVSFPHPHGPFNPTEPYASMYAPEDSALPDSGYEVNDDLPLVFRLALLGGDDTRAEAEDQQRLRAFLAVIRGLVREIDDAVGRLVGHVDEHSTLVAYTSDHGDYAGRRGLMSKVPWLPFEDLARVPFVIAGPGVAGGRRIAHPVQSCDFALTALDYAGVTPPQDVVFDSRSLRAVLEDPEDPGDPDRIVASALSVGWPAVRRGRFKYIEHEERFEGALFDLLSDPDERRDLAADPEHAETRAELAIEVRRLLARPELMLAADA